MPGYFALSPTLCTCSPIRLCALETRGHGLATSFPNEWSFFSPFFLPLWRWRSPASPGALLCLCGEGCLRTNGIKFKFKCGRDVKSTVGKKIGDCKSTGGRLVVAFHKLSDHQNSGGSVDIASADTRARAHAHNSTNSHNTRAQNTAPDDRRTACLYPL